MWLAALVILFLPFAGQAAIPGQTGILIKGERTAAIYYFGADGKRYVFPNEKTYRSWYEDFSEITVLNDADLASIPLGGNVTYRPGVKLVKVTTDPKVYAVAKNGFLRWVTSETLADSIYGSDWKSLVEDVPDAFFVNYTIGNPIQNITDFIPSLARQNAPTISADKDLVAIALPQPSVPEPIVPEPAEPEPETQQPEEDFVIKVGAEELPSSILVHGTNALARMKVTAGPNAEIAVKSIVWSLQKTPGFGLTETIGSSVREVETGANISGSATVVLGDCSAGASNVCQVQTVFSSERAIAPGDSKTFELRMMADSVTSGQSVTAQVVADSGVVTGQLTNIGSANGDSVEGARYNFIWSDMSAIPHNDAIAGSADWTNGFLVDGIPTDAKSLVAP